MEQKRSPDSKTAGTHKHNLGFLNFGNSFFENCGRREHNKKEKKNKAKVRMKKITGQGVGGDKSA